MRPSRDSMFMEIARVVSKRSTCYRNNVGAVVVANRRPVSIGYNGSPPGHPHCEGNDCPLAEGGGCKKSVHAEVNAIRYIPANVKHQNLHLYVTHSPCLPCAHVIGAAGGFSKVFYEQEYRITAGIDFLLELGIEVYRYTPAGFLVNRRSNDILIP